MSQRWVLLQDSTVQIVLSVHNMTTRVCWNDMFTGVVQRKLTEQQSHTYVFSPTYLLFSLWSFLWNLNFLHTPPPFLSGDILSIFISVRNGHALIVTTQHPKSVVRSFCVYYEEVKRDLQRNSDKQAGERGQVFRPSSSHVNFNLTYWGLHD